MINLAGNKNADLTIKEELHLAGIETRDKKGNGEVPYSIIGKIGDWKFERAWYYWIASVDHDEDGLPLEIASKLHESSNPIDSDKLLGYSIRCGGHCGCPHPSEFGASPILDEKLFDEIKALGIKNEKMSYNDIKALADAGKINLRRYVNCYHIDDQIGLNEFAKTLKEFYKDKWK